MSSLFSKALVYLGLVDEEQLGQEEGYEAPAEQRQRAQYGRQPEQTYGRQPEQPRPAQQITPEGRRVEPPAASSRTAAVRAEGPSVAGVRQIRPEAQADILVIEEFGDAKILADRVRDRVPVVLDFRHVGADLVRRVVDFSSGLIYALDGTMSKVGEGLVLVLPPNTVVTPEEKRRLKSLGAYELDIDD